MVYLGDQNNQHEIRALSKGGSVMLSLFNQLMLTVYLFIFGGAMKKGWQDEEFVWERERSFSDPIWLPEQDTATWWIVVKWVYGVFIFGTLWIGKYYLGMDFSAIQFAEYLGVTGGLAFIADTFIAALVWFMSIGVIPMALMALTEPIHIYCTNLFKISQKRTVKYLANSKGEPSAYFYEPTNGLTLIPNRIAESKWHWLKVPAILAFSFFTVGSVYVMGIMFPIAISFNL